MRVGLLGQPCLRIHQTRLLIALILNFEVLCRIPLPLQQDTRGS